MELIAEGGMSTVHHVRRGYFDYAHKCLKNGFEPHFLKREFRALELCSDIPNIINCQGLFTEEPVSYLELKFAYGGNLRRIGKAYNDLKTTSWRDASWKNYITSVVKCLSDISTGVGLMHEKGIIHRDIRHDNIMVLEHLLIDFGIAYFIGEEDFVQKDRVAGCMGYVPPEIFTGSLPSPSTDVFAIGCTLYEHLATGNSAFPGKSQKEKGKATMRCDPINPRALNPLASPKLAELTMRCLHKLPEARPSPIDLSNELKSIIKHSEL